MGVSFRIYWKSLLGLICRRLHRPTMESRYFDFSWQVHSLVIEHGVESAMKLAVGGSFEAMGILERELLIQYGLQPHHYLIDVGCGAGRLAKPLSEYLLGAYLGTDVVPELLEYARQLVERPHWRFEFVRDLVIPEADAQADVVCFFSVFTHLLHWQSYVYLREAHRVLKPGGKVVFSFLDFAIPSHWSVFESWIVEGARVNRPIDQFLSRDAIHAWASHLGFSVAAIEDGDKPHIPLRHPVVLEDGSVLPDKGNFGQSVCVLIRSS